MGMNLEDQESQVSLIYAFLDSSYTTLEMVNSEKDVLWPNCRTGMHNMNDEAKFSWLHLEKHI